MCTAVGNSHGVGCEPLSMLVLGLRDKPLICCTPGRFYWANFLVHSSEIRLPAASPSFK